MGTKLTFLAIANAMVLVSSALDVPPPKEVAPVVDKREQTAEQYGFIVQSGADLSKGSKAYVAARFVRLFYIGYAFSQNAPQDIRAEAMRRSMGNNNASWADLWQAAKNMASEAAGNGDGRVNLLFGKIGDLEDPEVQFNRMMKDKDYIPCAAMVLGGLLTHLSARQQQAWQQMSNESEDESFVADNGQQPDASVQQSVASDPQQAAQAVRAIEAAIRMRQSHIRDLERQLQLATHDYTSTESMNKQLYANGSSLHSNNMFALRRVQQLEGYLKDNERALDRLYNELSIAKDREARANAAKNL